VREKRKGNVAIFNIKGRKKGNAVLYTAGAALTGKKIQHNYLMSRSETSSYQGFMMRRLNG
jgi:hypothetical protein